MFVYVCFRNGCTCRERRGVHVGRGEGERGEGKGRGTGGGGKGRGTREEGAIGREQGRRGQRKWDRDFVQDGFVCI